MRETKEELDCDVDIVKYLGFNDFNFNGRKLRSHKFFADLKEGAIPKVMEPDVFKSFFWLPIKDYKRYSVAPNLEHFCEQYIRGEI